jgi:hypothetical protein
VLGLAFCCYATSVSLHGNGFIAAFTGGLAFAATGGPAAKLVPFVEETGTMLSLLVWLMFGVVPALRDLTWQTMLSAVQVADRWRMWDDLGEYVRRPLPPTTAASRTTTPSSSRQPLSRPPILSERPGRRPPSMPGTGPG